MNPTPTNPTTNPTTTTPLSRSDIPQIENERARATACSSARACVRSFPCQVRTVAAAAAAAVPLIQLDCFLL